MATLGIQEIFEGHQNNVHVYPKKVKEKSKTSFNLSSK